MFDFENDDDTFDAQRLINSGLAWRMEGHIGRQCMRAIEDGACMLGHTLRRDAYGNVVPSRYQVEAGTKGSFDYVAERYGVEHAETQAAK